jgi:hypothetical protein
MMRQSIRLTITFVLVSIMTTSCSHKEEQKQEIRKKDELIVFLDSLEKKYEAACYNTGMANWNSYSKEGPYDLNAAKAEFAAIFLDGTSRAIIEDWRGRAPSLADKVLARRLELWHRCFIGGTIYADSSVATLENALQQRITNFAFTLGGSPTTRAKVINRLRSEKSQAKRNKLWSVTGQLSTGVAEDLRRLVKLRNERAKVLGFKNYFSLVLHLQAIDEAWLLKTMNVLEEKTHDSFDEFIAASKKKLRLKKFCPWDFDFALREAISLPDKYFPSDSVFDIIHRFQKEIGFKVDSLPIKEVVKDIPYNGLSLAITIPADSRFLVNPTEGKGFYGVAFHEYGHSLKAVHTDVAYPILRGYEWIPGAQCAAYEEGIADMHGEFTDDSLWLAEWTQAKTKEVERYVKGRSIPALYRMRRLLKDFFIEYEMYNNPDQDLAALEHDMFEKYLAVEFPDDEPHQYAASIWYTSYPCYYQNYIVSGMIATQLQEAMSNKFGEEKIKNPAVAAWMIQNLYGSGETEEWTDRIRNATGKSLETGAYLRKLGIETTHILSKEQ